MKVNEKIIYVNKYNVTSYSNLEDLLQNYEVSSETRKQHWRKNFYIKEDIVRNIEFSAYYRKIVRDNSTDDAMSLLMEYAPSLKLYMNMNKLREYIDELKDELADYDIVRLPIDADIVVNGVVYHGAKDLKAASRDESKAVSNRWEGFPCFDSYDYADENRCYNNYCFCTKDSEAWKIIEGLAPQQMNFCLVGEHLPKEAIPMVYVNDDEKTLLYAHR